MDTMDTMKGPQKLAHVGMVGGGGLDTNGDEGMAQGTQQVEGIVSSGVGGVLKEYGPRVYGAV